MGISNTIATIPGFLAPYVVGVLTDTEVCEKEKIIPEKYFLISRFKERLNQLFQQLFLLDMTL